MQMQLKVSERERESERQSGVELTSALSLTLLDFGNCGKEKRQGIIW